MSHAKSVERTNARIEDFYLASFLCVLASLAEPKVYQNVSCRAHRDHFGAGPARLGRGRLTFSRTSFGRSRKLLLPKPDREPLRAPLSDFHPPRTPRRYIEDSQSTA